MERIHAELNEDVRNKILVDLKGNSGSWEKIKHVIHYAVIIEATYAQATKGIEDINPRIDVMQPKGHGGHVCEKETRQSHSCRFNLYKKEEIPKE